MLINTLPKRAQTSSPVLRAFSRARHAHAARFATGWCTPVSMTTFACPAIFLSRWKAYGSRADASLMDETRLAQSEP
jgi:hypothetical protein